MSKMAWVKWGVVDFLNGIVDLDSPVEIGVYTVLIHLIYDLEKPVPYSIERIAKRCHMRPSSCEKVIQSLIEKGKLTLENGEISHKTCSKVLESRQRLGENLSESAKKRWEKDNEIKDVILTTHSPLKREDKDKEKETIGTSPIVSAGDKPPAAKPKKTSPKKCGRRIEADEKPNPKQIADAHERGFARESAWSEWQKFRDHHLSKGTVFVDWDAAWRTWLGNAIKWAGQGGGNVVALNGGGGGRRVGNMTLTVERSLAHIATMNDDDDLH